MSLDKNLNLKIVSQTQHIYEGPAYEITLPAINGILNILPGHTALISLLQVGEILAKTKDFAKKILISGGLAHIKNDTITVLADEAILPEELVRKEIDKAIEDAQKQKSYELPSSELIQLEKQLKFEMFKRKFLEDNK